MSGSSLLSRVSRTEREFISASADIMLGESGAKSQEDKLSALASYFKRQKVGSGEAILAQRMARLPSEISNQRYCGEEALRNLLFLEHLGIPALLLTTGNFKGTGQPHANVFLSDTNQILDWGEITEVRRNGKQLLSDKGRLIAKEFVISPPASIFRDVGRFREDNLLDAFSYSQDLIDRVEYTRGNIESSVKYDSKRQEISITQLVNDLTMNIPFYHETSIQVKGNKMLEVRTAGLAPSREGISCFKIPILYDVNGNALYDDFLSEMRPEEKDGFVLGMAYKIMSKNGRKILVSDSESEEFLEFLRYTSNRSLDSPNAQTVRQAQVQLAFYETAKEAYGEPKAREFLKALEFKVTFVLEHKDPLRALLRYSGFKSMKELGERFVYDNMNLLNRHYFNGRNQTPEKILVQKLYERKHIFSVN